MTESPRNLPDYLRRSEQRLLCKIAALAALERGCFAKRETLARMIGYSVHTVNSDISRLARRGYVVVTTKGRGRDEAGTIKITPSGLETTNRIQAEYKHSPCSTHDGLMFLEQQQTTPTAASTPKPPKPVVSVELPSSSIEEPASNIIEPLLTAGIRKNVAKKLAAQNTHNEVVAALRYVSQYRGEKLNAPGMLVSALSNGWRLPKWCYESVAEEKRLREMPSETRSHVGVCYESDWLEKFMEARSTSPWHDVWGCALDKMGSGEDLACWVAPLNVNTLRSWVYIDNLEESAVDLVAHAEYSARAAQSMAAQIGAALGVERVVVRVEAGVSGVEF